MDRIRLDVTVDQARAMARGFDLVTRIGLGQLEEIAHLFTDGTIKPTEAVPVEPIANFLAVQEQLQNALSDAKRALGHPDNGSFGVGSPRVAPDIHRVYEVMKVLDKALFDLRPDASTAFKGPNSDGLIVRYTTDPAPVVTIISAAEAA